MRRTAKDSFPFISESPFTTAWSCAVVLAVALGVGRFAFTPMLPLMLGSGVLDIRQGGWLASANYAGYLLGAVSCVALRFEYGRVVRMTLVATVALTLAMAITHTFLAWFAIRFTAGVFSAWAFVFASQWGLRRLAEQNAAALAGIIYAGSGIGIVATGLLGALAGRFGISAALVWMIFAVASGLASAAVWRAFGYRPVAKKDGGMHQTSQMESSEPRPDVTTYDVVFLIGLYGLAGFGYIITATFLPVIARQALPDSPWPDFFWPAFGLALIIGALTAARLPASWDNRCVLAGCYFIQALGIVMGIFFPSALGLGVGSLLLGLPFTVITMFAMREARRLRGDNAAGLMGYATGSYGLGQIAGPLIAAPIASYSGSFVYSLWIAVFALSGGGAALAYLGSRRRPKIRSNLSEVPPS